MLFSMICTDKPGAFETRLAVRGQHLAYLATYGDRILMAGQILNGEQKACGSLLLINVEDRAAAEGFAASDPYTKADLFESIVIRRYRPILGFPTKER